MKVLCNPQTERRKVGLRESTIVKMNFMLGYAEEEEAMHENSKGGRCHTCLEVAYGPGYSKN